MNAFFALEPRWMGLDRFYKVYVTDQELRGARIGGQVFDEESAFRQLIAPAQILGPLMRLWARRILGKVRRREAEYDAIVLSSDLFLRNDRANFVLNKADVAEVGCSEKKRLWTGYSQIAGTLTLKLRNHSRREWIIPGNQDIHGIAALLGFSCGTPEAGRQWVSNTWKRLCGPSGPCPAP